MNTRRLVHTLLVAAICVVAAPVARADVDDFRVNDDGGTAIQTNPRIAVAADGSFVIAWSDRRAGENDIYVQRYDGSANAIGYNRRANDDTNMAWQAEPSLACDFSGRYWLTWKDYRNGVYPFDADIYFQRYDTGGALLGGNRDLTLEPPDSLKETPDIAVSPTGAVVVVWADYRNLHWDIYGQLIGADGSLIGSNFRVNTDAGTGQQHAPRVAYAEDGWFVVVWYDNRLGNDDIFVQRFDSLAQPLGGNVKVNSDPGDARQAFPDVAADAAGRFTVVWVDWRNGRYPANPDIYSRTFNTALTPINSDVRLNTDGTVRAQREATIAADRLGNVAIIWSDSIGSSFDIVGQMIDADGVVREANFQANSYVDSAQIQADVALDGRFRYLTWVDKRNGNFDIYAAIQQYNDPTLSAAPLYITFEMNESGTPPESAGLIISHAGYNPIPFEIIASESWVQVSPSGGTSVDTVAVSVVDNTLAPGSYLATLTIIDTAHDDSSLTVPVTLTVNDVIEPSLGDTLIIGSAVVARQSVGSVPIDVRLNRTVSEVVLPLRYDTSVVRIDSAVADPGLPTGYEFSFEVDDIAGETRLSIRYDTLSGSLGTGVTHLAEIFFTAGDVDARMPLDTAHNDTLIALVVDTAGDSVAPVVLPGEIVVGTPTDVGTHTGSVIPGEVTLFQNWPNPFNLETTIRFRLPAESRLRLAIYNVLGQLVSASTELVLSAGEHELRWDGSDRQGRAVSSGVYFYRLEYAGGHSTRKMLLLK